MATAYQNLSSYDPASVPDASDMRVAIVCAEWNAYFGRTGSRDI